MTLRLWTNGFDTYVAERPADILAMYKAWSGDDLDEDEHFVERMDATLTITIADADEERQRITKTAAEWIADSGPGLLCSTEY